MNVIAVGQHWWTILQFRWPSSPLGSDNNRASLLKSFCYSLIKYKHLSLSFITCSFHCILYVRSDSLWLFSLLGLLAVLFLRFLWLILSHILQFTHKINNSPMSEEPVAQTRTTEWLRVKGTSGDQPTCSNRSQLEQFAKDCPVGFWTSQKIENLQPSWATCSSAWPPSKYIFF